MNEDFYWRLSGDGYEGDEPAEGEGDEVPDYEGYEPVEYDDPEAPR